MTGRAEIVHIGCYTAESEGRGTGVVAALRDPATGLLHVRGTVAVTPSPSFLARHPTLPVLYAVNELAEGTVSAWTVGRDGDLTPSGVRSTGGDSPCHLAVSPDGRHLFVANYGSGSIAVHSLDEEGSPAERSDLLVHEGHGPDPQRQAGPHVHMVVPDAGGLFAVDLGTDTVYRYAVDQDTGRLVPGRRVRVRPGTGPRHLAGRSGDRRRYLTGELDRSVTVFERVEDGELTETGRVPASEQTGHVQPSEIAVRDDGRFLYVANRGVGTISTYALSDAEPPRLVAETDTGGEWPRHFALAGPHLYVADERAHLVTVFVLDGETGIPRFVDEPVEVPSPTCVLP